MTMGLVSFHKHFPTPPFHYHPFSRVMIGVPSPLLTPMLTFMPLILDGGILFAVNSQLHPHITHTSCRLPAVRFTPPRSAIWRIPAHTYPLLLFAAVCYRTPFVLWTFGYVPPVTRHHHTTRCSHYTPTLPHTLPFLTSTLTF